jgi:hypothetical protein
MKYFGFSKKLSMFSEILRSAAFDILFFALMFMIVLVGYTISTYVQFGIRNEDFSTLTDSLLSNFLIVIGSYGQTELDVYDQFMIRFMSISFLIVNLLLLNMFIAIIGSHYFEYYAVNSGHTETALSKLIVRILLSKDIELLLLEGKKTLLKNKN